MFRQSYQKKASLAEHSKTDGYHYLLISSVRIVLSGFIRTFAIQLLIA